MERLKKREYQSIFGNYYFWRTWDQKEIDLVEDREGKLYGYEFKYKSDGKDIAPRVWQDTYPSAEYSVVTRDNFLEFVT